MHIISPQDARQRYRRRIKTFSRIPLIANIPTYLICFNALHPCRSPPPKMHASLLPHGTTNYKEKLERKIRPTRCAPSEKIFADASTPFNAKYITQMRSCSTIVLLPMWPTHHRLHAPMNRQTAKNEAGHRKVSLPDRCIEL